jgi:hypothetical protein
MPSRCFERGLRDFDLHRVAKASTELVRTGVLQFSHELERSNTVRILRYIFRHIEEWRRNHQP